MITTLVIEYDLLFMAAVLVVLYYSGLWRADHELS